MTTKTSTIGIKGRATAKSRTNLGLHHLFAACRAVARIGQVENENVGSPFGAFWEAILHDSLVAAIATVASLESYANELYFEANFIGATMNSSAATELIELIDRESILRKFSVALAFQSGKKLDFGNPAVQNVRALIKLRNLVVHYRSEWSNQAGTHQKMSELLRGKFKPSPFLSAEESLFQKSWASYSFGCWSIQSTCDFMSYFFNEAGMKNPLDLFRGKIEALAGIAL